MPCRPGVTLLVVMGMYKTTELTSGTISSDNPLHQRLLFPYREVAASGLTGSMLELGCGWGRGLQWVLPAVTHYTGVDKNADLVSLLRANHHQANFVAASLPDLSFLASNSFDNIICFQVIEHIADDAALVREAHRVLKPAGKLFLTTINKAYSLTRNPWHVREYDALGLKTLLQQYFPALQQFGIHGGPRMLRYHQQQAAEVQKIVKLDVLNLQYHLPAWVLRPVYDVANRHNRNKLLQTNPVAAEIGLDDFVLSNCPSSSFDLFYIATK